MPQGVIIRAVILVNPHNPLGEVYTPQEMASFLEFAKRYVFPLSSLMQWPTSPILQLFLFFSSFKHIALVQLYNPWYVLLYFLYVPCVLNTKYA